MSDPISIRPQAELRSLPGHEYWQIAREIKKQESVYPKHTRAAIKAAVEFAFNQGGDRFDSKQVERFVAMYLTSNDVK